MQFTNKSRIVKSEVKPETVVISNHKFSKVVFFKFSIKTSHAGYTNSLCLTTFYSLKEIVIREES